MILNEATNLSNQLSSLAEILSFLCVSPPSSESQICILSTEQAYFPLFKEIFSFAKHGVQGSLLFSLHD